MYDDALNKIITNDVIFSNMYVRPGQLSINYNLIFLIFFAHDTFPGNEYARMHVESICDTGNVPINNCLTSEN